MMKIEHYIVAFIAGLILGYIFNVAVDWGYAQHFIVGVIVYVLISVQMAALVMHSGLRAYSIPIVVDEAVALGIMYAH